MKTYASPMLTTFGTVADLTAGYNTVPNSTDSIFQTGLSPVQSNGSLDVCVEDITTPEKDCFSAPIIKYPWGYFPR